MEDSPQRAMQGLGSFPWYVGGTQVLGLACVVITGVWMGSYHGGYAWDGSGQEFNVHPLCMVLGLVFLYGDGKAELNQLKLELNQFLQEFNTFL